MWFSWSVAVRPSDGSLGVFSLFRQRTLGVFEGRGGGGSGVGSSFTLSPLSFILLLVALSYRRLAVVVSSSVSHQTGSKDQVKVKEAKPA